MTVSLSRRGLLFAGVPAMAGAWVLSSCSSSSDAESVAADQLLTIGTVNTPSGLNVFTASDIAATWALRFTLDPLLDQSEPLKFVPRIAQSIESTDNINWTIKLRSGATWSDGQPITADDIVFTFNTMANPKAAMGTSTYLTTLDGVSPATGKLASGTEIPALKKVDDTTVTFKTASVVDNNYIMEMIGTKVLILPKHTLKDIAPEGLAKSDYGVKGPTVFSGAYKITKFTKDTSIEYEANPTYYAGKPKISNVVMKIMPAANLAGELSAGTITMNSGGGIGNIPFGDMETVKGLSGVATSINPSIGFQTMYFNTLTFTDKRVRQAIAHAINRPQIVSQLLKGNGEVIDGPFSSVNPYLDKGLTPIAYDPEKAKSLLAASGWDTSKEINFVIPTGNSVREASADIIMENLKAIGLNVKGSKYDFPTAFSMAGKHNYDLVLIGLTLTMDPDVTSVYGPGATYNFTSWKTDRNSELLAKGKQTVGQAARTPIYKELQAIWQDELPVLTLYSNYEVSAKQKPLKVGGAPAFWSGMMANVEAWQFGAA